MLDLPLSSAVLATRVPWAGHRAPRDATPKRPDQRVPRGRSATRVEVGSPDPRPTNDEPVARDVAMGSLDGSANVQDGEAACPALSGADRSAV